MLVFIKALNEPKLQMPVAGLVSLLLRAHLFVRNSCQVVCGQVMDTCSILDP